MKRSLYSYIKKNVNDKYIMDALYYCLRKTIIKIVFNGGNMRSFNISTRFVIDPIELELSATEHTNRDVLAILLSIRTLMLDPNTIELCSSDNLIFTRGHRTAYGWLDFASLIMRYNTDEDFHEILCLLSTLYDNCEINEEDKQSFIDNTICPECRNIKNYYKEAASRTENIPKDVIPNNAFLCNYELTNLIISEKQGYIGNTAIAFCPNLKIIKIENPNLLFGKFPLLECPNLEHIYVPVGSLEYYRENLPFYKDIISEIAPTIEVKDENIIEDPLPQIKQDSERTSDISHNDKAPMLGRMYRYVKENIKEKLIRKEPEKVDDLNKDEQRTNLIKKSLEKKVTTYKYFWILAILESIKENENNSLISMKELNKEMLVKAWIYSMVYDGSFPNGDQLPSLCEELFQNSSIAQSEDDEEIIRSFVDEEYVDNRTLFTGINKLANNAPYRFLSPWIPFTTTSDVVKLSGEFKNDSPYSVSKEGIVVNPSWLNYFERNSEMLEEFLESQLYEYLDISDDDDEDEEDVSNWNFIDNVYFERASKPFLKHNCRVVMAESGYYLEVDNEYIKLGDYPDGFDMWNGSIWIKRPKVGSKANRIVHVDCDHQYEIGKIEESDNLITFINPSDEEYTITFN